MRLEHHPGNLRVTGGLPSAGGSRFSSRIREAMKKAKFLGIVSRKLLKHVGFRV